MREYWEHWETSVMVQHLFWLGQKRCVIQCCTRASREMRESLTCVWVNAHYNHWIYINVKKVKNNKTKVIGDWTFPIVAYDNAKSDVNIGKTAKFYSLMVNLTIQLCWYLNWIKQTTNIRIDCNNKHVYKTQVIVK